MVEKRDLEGEGVVLESMGVDPFKGWSDWYGTDGEALVTFETMQHSLWDSWNNQCVEIKKYDEEGNEIKPNEFNDIQEYMNAGVESERIVKPEKFDYNTVKLPGVYRSDTHYDKKDYVDESYTIVVPHGFLTPELCQKYIDKLNKKFDRKFKLKIEEEQKQPISQLKLIKTELERNKTSEGTIEKLEEIIKELSDN